MSKALRCVVDTNVFISAALNAGSLPNRVVTHVIEEGLLLLSEATIIELRTRLALPKFDPYQSAEKRRRFGAFIESQGERVKVDSVVTDSSDPADNPFLALALDGNADYIVTGDKKHLLPLHPYRGIPVLSPRTFAEAVGLL